METLTFTQPDDWHCHFRDDDYLKRTVIDTASEFGRAIVMPNLVPPVTSTELATQYRQRILAVLPATSTFQPLMTLYLTDQTTAAMIEEAKKSGVVIACKLYPAGATTHSDSGVTHLNKIAGVLEAMQECGLPLCVHGEVTDPSVDVFDREARFIDEKLIRLHDQFPRLKIILEHISTAYATEAVTEMRDTVAATITAHHLLLNRNDLLVGGIKPHHYCLPVVKRQTDQLRLIKAATSGNPKFFLGTDSAPHTKETKEHSCGCAGIYTAHAAIEFYAHVFSQANALDKLEGFASFFGADFYGLPRHTTTITLRRQPKRIPEFLNFGDSTLIPFYAGKTLDWSLSHEEK